jgi:hypothetical protein
MSLTSAAVVPTDKARRYMSQLVKHFAHKVETGLDEDSGHIAFDFGRCDLSAQPNGLVLKAQAADAASLARLQDVIVRHLERFAFREPVAVSWA